MAIHTSGKIKRAFANISASTTDGDIVTAVSDKKIRVHAVVFQCGGTATAATFNTKGSGAGTAISMQFQNGSNGGAVLPESEVGWFETALGAGLTLTTGAGSTTGVHVIYSEA